MSDLTTLLHRAAASAPVTSPTEAAVLADVARGRAAHGRRKVRALSAGLTAGVAATVLAVGVGASILPHSAPVAEQPKAPAATTALKLTSYTGAQPKGFKIDKVPVGWTVSVTDDHNIVLAPGGAAPAASSGTASGTVDYRGLISIEYVGDASVPVPLTGPKTEVGGKDATIFSFLGASGRADGTKGLFVDEGEDANLAIQIPARLHWSDQQIAAFGSGIHLEDGAVKTKG